MFTTLQALTPFPHLLNSRLRMLKGLMGSMFIVPGMMMALELA
jgi:hypothetical protein